MRDSATLPTKSAKPGFRLGRNSEESHLLRLLLIAIAIFALFSFLLPTQFPTVQNLQSMAVQFPEFGILAIAIMLTMLTGGIDLSAVSIANLSAVGAALTLGWLVSPDATLVQALPGMAVALVVIFGIGTICGLFNGFLIARVGIAPILATLGTLSLYAGFAVAITKGRAQPGVAQLLFLGSGDLWGVPMPMVVFLLLALLFSLILGRTTFGFNVYMLGSNPTAARFSGINTVGVLLRTYWLSGLLAAVAGLIFLARNNSAKPDYGESYTLLTVLIAILGGVSYTGGFGRVAGLVLAILCLQFLSTGLNMFLLDFSGSSGATFFRQFAWGALLILVMVSNYISSQRQARRT
jgi:simple sugar transport system permease protein